MNTQNWSAFTLGELFDIYTGKDLIYSSLTYGEYPVIGHKAENNGITAYTKELDGYTLYDNTSTISLGDRGNFFAAVQSRPFYIGTRVKALTAKFRSNTHILLFIATLINKESFRFSYGRNSCDRTDNITIKLPSINIKGKLFPDLDYIEKLTKEHLIPLLPSKSKAIWKNQYDNKPIHSTHISLDSVKWDWFVLSDIFEQVYKGKSYNAQDLIFLPFKTSSSLPYATRTDENNGIKGFVLNNNFSDIESSNAITIGDTTSTIYYQDSDFICGEHIVILRSQHLNKYRAMFIVSILNKERFRYCYGRAYTLANIKKTKLRLPIKQDGSLNLEFMENYIKSLPYSANI